MVLVNLILKYFTGDSVIVFSSSRAKNVTNKINRKEIMVEKSGKEMFGLTK